MTQPPPGNYPPPPPAGGGGFPPQQPQGAPPSSNLVLGILTTLFCCLPFGIVSIVKASQVNGLWAQGRFAEAQASSDAAKKWAIWSVVAAVAIWIIYAILFALGAVSFDMDTSSTY
jgi:Interferon-induced transmembrane protein